jgi:hypothetical protein
MISDRGVLNVVLICGVSFGEKAVLSRVEVVEAGVVLDIKQILIASGRV